MFYCKQLTVSWVSKISIYPLWPPLWRCKALSGEGGASREGVGKLRLWHSIQMSRWKHSLDPHMSQIPHAVITNARTLSELRFYSLLLNAIFYFPTAAFGQMVLKLNTREKYMQVTKVCASCTKMRTLSSPSSVAVPSQVITAKRFAMTNYITNHAIVDFILIPHSLTEQVIDWQTG